MNGIFKAIREGTESGFVTKVPVVINHPDYEYTEDKVSIFFDLELDYRSWGLKDVSVSFSEPVSVYAESFDTYSGESRGTKEFSIDLNKYISSIDWVAGSSFVPVSLEVYLRPDETIETAVLVFSYIDKQL